MGGEGRKHMQWGKKMAAELCEAAAEGERPGGKNSYSQPWQAEQLDVETKWRLNAGKYIKYTT